MDWFRHDINAHLDLKIRKLIRQCGYEAYGIYWFIVELVYGAGGEMNLKDLTDELEFIEKSDVLSVLSDLGLISISEDKVSSRRVLEEIDYQESCKRKKSEAGKKGMDARYNKSNSVITEPNNDITVLEGCYNSDITDPNNVITEPNNVITPSNKGITEPNTYTITNTNTLYKEKKIYKKKKFVPPTEQEVIQFCTQRQNGVDGKRVYDYYNEAEWHDRNGDPIKNWKQKIIGVWEKNNPTSKQTVCNDPSKMTADMNASGGFDL